MRPSVQKQTTKASIGSAATIRKDFISRAERDSLAARSLRAKLAALITSKPVRDFAAGMLCGLVMFSPILLDIAGCIRN